MLRKLSALKLPPATYATPRVQLPTGVPGLLLGPRPTMLLGGAGSGKSARLVQTARDAIKPPADSSAPPCPVAYIRMRQTTAGLNPMFYSSNSYCQFNADADAARARLTAIAHAVYEQIGYPSRPSLVSMWRAQLRRPRGMSTQPLVNEERDRLVSALTMLFDAAEQLSMEHRKAGISEEHAPVVLLFDDVQELLAIDRVSTVGGRFVFDALAGLLATYGVDRHAVRAAVTGGSAQLAMAFDETVANGALWEHEEMRDPAPATIVAALEAKGYSPAEAKRMIDLVGTRLRLLERPLEVGAVECSCEEFLESSREVCAHSFLRLLDKDMAGSNARAKLLDVLQRIAAHEAGRGNPPTWYEMPEGKYGPPFPGVLYVRLDGALTFQSELHRNVWRELSSGYAEPLK
jgi:hypothetical protein